MTACIATIPAYENPPVQKSAIGFESGHFQERDGPGAMMAKGEEGSSRSRPVFEVPGNCVNPLLNLFWTSRWQRC
jgi:hypothetical protein